MSASGSFGVNLKKTWDGSTPLPAKVGDIGEDSNGAYMFVKASAAIAQYNHAVINLDYTATPTATAGLSGQPQPVGIAQTAFAANEYGWVFIGGAGGGGVGAGIKIYSNVAIATAGTAVTTTTTAGQGGTGGTKISGLTTAATLGAAGNVDVRSNGFLVVNP